MKNIIKEQKITSKNIEKNMFEHTFYRHIEQDRIQQMRV